MDIRNFTDIQADIQADIRTDSSAREPRGVKPVAVHFSVAVAIAS